MRGNYEAKLKPVILRMCTKQLWKKNCFWQAGVSFCPTRCFEGYDRWRQAFCVSLWRGWEWLLNSCSHLAAVCAQLVISSEGQMVLWQRQTNTPTMQQVHVNTVTPRPSIHYGQQWLWCTAKWQPLQLTSFSPAESFCSAIYTPRTRSILWK